MPQGLLFFVSDCKYTVGRDAHGTRSGDLDPGLADYLACSDGMDATQFDDMINFHSGLLGLSETSPDMCDLLRCEAADPRAADAAALFCYQVKKCIGAFAAALGGLDLLVFAGGIGENAAVIRERVCSGLEHLGIAINEAQNNSNSDLISTDSSRVKVRVMHTDEEQVIARSVCQVLAAGSVEP